MINTLTGIMTMLQGLEIGFSGLVEPTGNNGSWLVITPSGEPDRFFNHSREEPMQFQILAKHSNQLTAIQHIDAIKDALEYFGIETYTQPSKVEQDEKRSLYTALFRTKITKGAN